MFWTLTESMTANVMLPISRIAGAAYTLRPNITCDDSQG